MNQLFTAIDRRLEALHRTVAKITREEEEKEDRSSKESESADLPEEEVEEDSKCIEEEGKSLSPDSSPERAQERPTDPLRITSHQHSVTGATLSSPHLSPSSHADVDSTAHSTTSCPNISSDQQMDSSSSTSSTSSSSNEAGNTVITADT